MNYNPSSVMPNSITGMLPTPAVGYRFHPTNEELIINYLKPKMHGDNVEDLHIIAEVNVCQHEPWELPGQSIMKSDDLVWYFFCPRDSKYRKSRRLNRRTKEGFWKLTGKDVKIKARRTKKQIGIKKTLVFYKKASPKDLRTDWIIHEYEYTLDSNQSNQGEYFLCKLKKKSDEKSDKGEPNHHTPSVSDFEAEPSCGMTSDFEYQNRSEMTVNSAYNESENQYSNELMSNSACDIEYQNSSGLMPNSSSHLMASNFQNQYSNELMSNSACDIEYQNSNGLMPNSSSHLMASNFQNSNELMSNSACDIEYQNSNGLMPNSSSHLMASNFQNQYSNELMFNSACDSSVSLNSMAPGFENQCSKDLIVNSASNGSGLHHLMAPSFENQHSNALMSDSACDGSGVGSHQSMAFDFENQYSFDPIVNSPCENWPMAYDFENQVSSPQLNCECGPPVEMPPRFIDQSTYDKGETSCLAADDFENQNHDKESNISTSDEGACNPRVTVPLDLENRNPREKTDILSFEGFLFSYSTASFSANIAADSALTGLSPQQLADELKNSLNTPLQQSDMGFDISLAS